MKDEHAKSLINALLIKNPKQRGATTFEMIKGHSFFRNFDWNALLNETMTGPYIPKEFKHYSTEQFDDIVGKDLLKHIYKSDKQFEIEEWNGTV
jgi:hypothetical protein